MTELELFFLICGTCLSFATYIGILCVLNKLNKIERDINKHKRNEYE